MSYKCLAFAGQEDFLSNIVHLSNVGSMLGQRRRRWPNIKTALDQCLVWVVSWIQFSGYINAVNLYSIGYCWPTLDRPRHARFEAEWFFKYMVRAGITLTYGSVCRRNDHRWPRVETTAARTHAACPDTAAEPRITCVRYMVWVGRPIVYGLAKMLCTSWYWVRVVWHSFDRLLWFSEPHYAAWPSFT